MTMTSTPDLAQAARIALACLDLTSLNEGDTEKHIVKLCERAQTPFGHVAAVCVWPRLAAFARARLPADIAVAAVANFPHGGIDLALAVGDTEAIVQAGAQEVDVVLPYRHLDSAPALLAAVRKASKGLTLKVILETGELQEVEAIRRACRIALDAGADFLKTSTGKTPVSATPEAARLLLDAIANNPASRGRVGFKPSGGIRTVADAAVYIDLARHAFGEAGVGPARLRLGASGLLDDIVSVLAGQGSSPTSGATY
jgi:deoxyribose-phosphate aldolase